MVDQEVDSELFFHRDQSSEPATDHVYCGTVKPGTYYADNGELNLRYWSNGLTSGAGFQVHISLSSSCDRHYSGLQGRVGLTDTNDNHYPSPSRSHTESVHALLKRHFGLLFIYFGGFRQKQSIIDAHLRGREYNGHPLQPYG